MATRFSLIIVSTLPTVLQTYPQDTQILTRGSLLSQLLGGTSFAVLRTEGCIGDRDSMLK